jgi:L-rhamnose mutarotase
MSRVAFRLQLRPECIQAYEEAHRRVWPELLAVLKEAGISEYSIFRRGTELFFYLRVSDFERAWSQISSTAVDQRWQVEMSPFFAPCEDLRPGERFAMMEEVFYLE